LLCTWADLRRQLEACAGEVDAITEFDIDHTFEEIGYDSLAILETVSALERHYRIKLPDDDAGEIKTPRDFLEVINHQLTLQREAA
jgi:minimal PKS acyl carrier protein